MIGKLSEVYRNNIRIVRKTNPIETIKLCSEFLNFANNTNDKWFANHNIALMYSKLGNIKKSFDYGFEALCYVDNNNPDYYLTIWLLAGCYDKLHKYKEARSMYFECSNFYKLIDDDYFRITVLFNIAKTKKDIEKIIKIIKIAESKKLNRILDDYEELDNLVQTMYIEALEICINNKELHNKILKLINSTKDDILRKKMIKFLNTTYSKVS